MSEVVSLHGTGVVLAVGEPQWDAIQECERLLERLKSGEVQGFVYAQLWRDSAVSWSSAGPTASYAVAGALNAAAHCVIKQREKI